MSAKFEDVWINVVEMMTTFRESPQLQQTVLRDSRALKQCI